MFHSIIKKLTQTLTTTIRRHSICIRTAIAKVWVKVTVYLFFLVALMKYTIRSK